MPVCTGRRIRLLALLPDDIQVAEKNIAHKYPGLGKSYMSRAAAPDGR